MTYPKQITSPPQAAAEVVTNENLAALAHIAVYAKKADTTSGLTWGYYGGRWGGFSIADATIALTASSTCYLVVAIATGVLSMSTTSTNWADTANYARVYKLTTSASVVTAVEDHRAGPGGVMGGAGASGGSGGAVATGLEYIASSTTTDADPGTGTLRWNNGTQSGATQLFIDNAEADGASLATFWASLSSGAYLRITLASNVDVWQLWLVTATPVNGTGYYKFTVTLEAQEGGNIANGAAVLLNVDAAGGGGGFTGGTLSSALNEAPPAALASAATVNIGAAGANTVTISGSTSITAFDTIAAGALRRLIFSGSLVIFNGTAIVLPMGNITTLTNDVAVFVSLGGGNWQLVEYQTASGRALAPTDITGIGTVVNTYSSAGSYTWTKPSNSNGLAPQSVEVLLLAAGGGGGSGRKGAAASVRCGGGGGGGGGIARAVFRASDVGGTVTVTVGAGGSAGAAVTANSTNGNNGGKGGDSSFGGLLRVVGGNGGGGGTNAAGTSGAGGAGYPAVANATSGGAGGAASTTGGVGTAGTATLASGAGGGSGGGITTANAASAGGAGGTVGTTTGAGYATVVAAGPAGTSGGGAGGTNNTSGIAGIASSGNGGGGSSTTGNGGDSGFMFPGGGGGGGGGAATDSVGNSGAGSLGGDGVVVVITYF